MLNPHPKMAKKKKVKSLKTLITKADQVFSRFIRARDNNICVTCGKPAQHAGHYIRRSHKKARWNVKNVHAQCCYCNTFLDGNMDAYALYLIEKYGVNVLEELASLKGTYKPTKEELEKIIDAYS